MRTFAYIATAGVFATALLSGCGKNDTPEPTAETMLSDISKVVQLSCHNDKLVIESKSKKGGLFGGGEITYWVRLMQEGEDTPHYSGYVVYTAKKGQSVAVEFNLKRGEGFWGGVVDVYKKNR